MPSSGNAATIAMTLNNDRELVREAAARCRREVRPCIIAGPRVVSSSRRSHLLPSSRHSLPASAFAAAEEWAPSAWTRVGDARHLRDPPRRVHLHKTRCPLGIRAEFADEPSRSFRLVIGCSRCNLR
jgi:hypothetical protein